MSDRIEAIRQWNELRLAGFADDPSEDIAFLLAEIDRLRAEMEPMPPQPGSLGEAVLDMINRETKGSN
jgi:hypothetical protein